MFQKSDYTYELPQELIAEHAIHPHHDARLMVIDKGSSSLTAETTFWELDQYTGADRVFFFNNSRVLRARISLKDIPYMNALGESRILTEGEIFYLKTVTSDTFEALVRPGNKFKIGAKFRIGEYEIEVTGMTEAGRILRISYLQELSTNFEFGILNLLSTHGTLPLPPYIEYTRDKEADYQTSFAEKDGSVAAPTASLHFTKELLAKLKIPKKYVTLHVGLGTFKGIDTEDVREYDIHQETIEITIQTLIDIAELKIAGKRIIAIGTTACRTLESLPSFWKKLDYREKSILDANICNYWDTITENLEPDTWIHDIRTGTDAGSINFETSIYITPGYTFRLVDDLITNFHLPESSLLVLVSAFLGHKATQDIYRYAIDSKYRFFSFGDGMYIRGK